MAVKLFLGKKSAILNGVLFWVKFLQSLLVEEILYYIAGFVSSKVLSTCLISGYRLFKSAELFFFSATLPSQKIGKEIAYILTSFQALLKAHFLFYLLIQVVCDEFYLHCRKANKSYIEDECGIDFYLLWCFYYLKCFLILNSC